MALFPGERDAVSLAGVKPSTDLIKLRQAAFSISQQGGRNHTKKESPLPAPEAGASSGYCAGARGGSPLTILERLQASCYASGAMVPLLCGGMAPSPPPLPPQASARTSLCFVCLWFPGKRFGRKGLPPQDSQASWLTWEMMLGSEGRGECSLEEGARGRRGGQAGKGFWVPGGLGWARKLMRRSQHAERKQESWEFKMGGGELGDRDWHMHTVDTTHQTGN